MNTRICYILLTSILLVSATNSSLAMRARDLTAEFRQALNARDIDKAQNVIRELRRQGKGTVATQLEGELDKLMTTGRVPGRAPTPTPTPPAGLLDTCEQQRNALLTFFGRYPTVGQSINNNKKTATKDLLFDTYKLLVDIGLPQQTTEGGSGLPQIFGPEAAAPDPYSIHDILDKIKQRFDVLSGAVGMARPAQDPNLSRLLQALNDPDTGAKANDIGDALDNFTDFGNFFGDAQSLNGIRVHIRNIATNYGLGGVTINTFADLAKALTQQLPDEIRKFLRDPNDRSAVDKEQAINNIRLFQRGITNAGAAGIADNLTTLGRFVIDVIQIRNNINAFPDGGTAQQQDTWINNNKAIIQQALVDLKNLY